MKTGFIKQLSAMILLGMFIPTMVMGAPELYLFDGVNTPWGDRNDGTSFVRLQTQAEEAHDFISNRRETQGAGDQFVVAHSQGGLRALAYASMVTSAAREGNGDTNHIKGIVTIGSPVRGFSPLRIGWERAVKKLTDIETTLNQGVDALSWGVGSAATGGIWEFIKRFTLEANSLSDFIFKVTGLNTAGGLPGDIYHILRGQTAESKPVVLDMAPNSEFISNNILPEKDAIQISAEVQEPRSIRVATGRYWKWTGWFQGKWVTTYKTMTSTVNSRHN